MNVCVTCGLSKELCICESIAKESQKIIVYIEEKSKRKKKKITVIEGIDEKEIDLDQLSKSLKAKLACGGTIKDKRIELQGEHKKKIRELLVEAGFPMETIIVK